jgi:glutamate/tyrosine decarboxylase-like PLP-dependent enzyme
VTGTTELGKIDPIEELSRICLEKDIYFHVDAAFELQHTFPERSRIQIARIRFSAFREFHL